VPILWLFIGPLKNLQEPPEFVSADYGLLRSQCIEGGCTEQKLKDLEFLDPKPGGFYLNLVSGAWSFAKQFWGFSRLPLQGSDDATSY
jgi:hypothetical protein